MLMRMKIFTRLLREFWFPTVLSVSWTLYNYCTAPTPWSIKDAVNILGPSFLVVSWVTGQVFRVRKQARDEHSFDKIIATITGADTYPKVSAVIAGPTPGGRMYPSGLHLAPVGAHSIYDLKVIVTDIERLRALHAAGQAGLTHQYQTGIQLGTLGRAYEELLVDIDPPAEGRPHAIEIVVSRSFHIQSFARNGQFNQRLLLREIGGAWFQASRVLHDGIQVHEHIEQGFPLGDLADIDPSAPIL
jgi:hypothetical protein